MLELLLNEIKAMQDKYERCKRNTSDARGIRAMQDKYERCKRNTSDARGIRAMQEEYERDVKILHDRIDLFVLKG